MYIYVGATVLASIIAGILIAALTKKAEDVTYGVLDKVGSIMNIALIPTYIFTAPVCMAVASLFWPAYNGILGVLGFIVSFVGATGPALCALGLGVSVALRKKGKSKLSFFAQFAGAIGLGYTLLTFFLFYGNLLETLN